MYPAIAYGSYGGVAAAPKYGFVGSPDGQKVCRKGVPFTNGKRKRGLL
jgi:hypothetical protein